MYHYTMTNKLEESFELENESQFTETFYLCKEFLESSGLPTPKGYHVLPQDELIKKLLDECKEAEKGWHKQETPQNTDKE